MNVTNCVGRKCTSIKIAGVCKRRTADRMAKIVKATSSLRKIFLT